MSAAREAARYTKRNIGARAEYGRKYGNGRRCLTLCVNIDVILAQYRCRSADRPIARRNGANIERKQRAYFSPMARH